MSRTRLALFALLCLAQLAVPLSMATRYERTLREGTLYRFRTEPVDPVDAFRGRYVAIRLRLVTPGERELPGSEEVYAVLAHDAEGFAIARSVSTERPARGDWVQGTAAGTVWEQLRPGSAARPRAIGTRIELPLDRYYMNERRAPQADRLWADANRQAEAVAVVRVRGGIAAIERLEVNGQPIERWVETLSPRP